MDRFQSSQNSSIIGPGPTLSGPLAASRGQLQRQICLVVVVVFFILGVAGNFLALVILTKKRNAKNSKYTLMLRWLATNNLIGLLGMSTQLVWKILIPSHSKEYARLFCGSMVIWRFFGVSSGCIAAVMAIERWMALARPFTYHKHITYNVIKKAINSLVFVATIITFLPFFGFGIYFDEVGQKCARYRDATLPLDIAYAYLFMIFGVLLCVIIVVCNLFVAQVLYEIGQNKTDMYKLSVHYDLVNRERRKDSENPMPAPLYHTNSSISNTTPTTSDEMKFAKLMAFLSISFVICWMPQMISVVLALKTNPLHKDHWFFRVADLLMALHFTSDPYVYVLSRSKNSYLLGCIKRWQRGIQRSQSDQSRLRPTIEQTLEYGLNT